MAEAYLQRVLRVLHTNDGHSKGGPAAGNSSSRVPGRRPGSSSSSSSGIRPLPARAAAAMLERPPDNGHGLAAEMAGLYASYVGQFM
jgi:hypothetical protein